MADYYYLLASMPLLTPGKTPAVTSGGFLAAAVTALPQRLYEVVERVMREEESAGDHPFLAAVADTEAQIRNAEAERRAEKRGTEPGPHLPFAHVDLSVAHGVEQAFQADSPLHRQRELVALRFGALDDMLVVRPYGEEAVLAYALKLRLALRLANIDPEEGRETFRDLADRAVRAAMDGRPNDDQPRSDA
ncbi:DUF2764 family protein [Oceanidesulfovibrio marinus]|uniref:DUF2764 family protein n=1 Tax=Oceanidesulfovibrio marinus TaxID=370038 RepID=A0A6P1ZGP5_9BACT|nr:DUF2764 family protein [Oceanidesulfovibrio marinus]QJT09231.1 DUF2764 family protein [Oceanidesulfovibrio marinus]TVM32726.1 hypothetical protein DQK91_13515 [Oceanidesulfovibrio marinus]